MRNLKYLPRAWTAATVVPIFRKGSKSDPGIYRPVSLTSVPCKILESMIKKGLMQHIERNDLIRESQHGFVKGKSCTTNLLEFMEKLTKIIDKGSKADEFYLGFAKAFDKVSH